MVCQSFFTKSQYDNFLLPNTTTFPAHSSTPLCVGFFVSCAIAFPALSRASTTKPREKTVPTAMISPEDKSNQAPLSCEDESRANPVPPGEITNTRGDIEICSVTIEPKTQHRVNLRSLVPTPTLRCTRLTPITKAPCGCVRPYAPFCLYAYAM